MFAAQTSWPTTFRTHEGEPIPGTGSSLKHANRYGVEGHVWLGPRATPFHVIGVMVRGSDDQELIEGADRDGTFSGGFLEVAYTPNLKTTFFGRYDAVSNDRQPVSDSPDDLNDQNGYAIGVRYTLHYSDRAEYAIHVEHSGLRIKGAAEDGSNVTTRTILVGFDFAF